MHFTLSPSEYNDKLKELCTETLMRLSAKCHRAPSSLFLKYRFEEKYENVLTVIHCLSEELVPFV